MGLVDKTRVKSLTEETVRKETVEQKTRMKSVELEGQQLFVPHDLDRLVALSEVYWDGLGKIVSFAPFVTVVEQKGRAEVAELDG